MNEALVEMALDPVPFRHFVVRDDSGEDYRYRCICGFASAWHFKFKIGRKYTSDHPHLVVTRSRTDLRPYPHPSQRSQL